MIYNNLSFKMTDNPAFTGHHGAQNNALCETESTSAKREEIITFILQVNV